MDSMMMTEFVESDRLLWKTVWYQSMKKPIPDMSRDEINDVNLLDNSLFDGSFMDNLDESEMPDEATLIL